MKNRIEIYEKTIVELNQIRMEQKDLSHKAKVICVFAETAFLVVVALFIVFGF